MPRYGESIAQTRRAGALLARSRLVSTCHRRLGMPAPTRSTARLALAFALVGAPAHIATYTATYTASRVAPSESFDLYVVGIRIAELAIADDSGSRSYTIRKKDVASNQ